MPAHSPSPTVRTFNADAISRAPVGIFDSGLGGLSVLRAVRAQLPHEAILYVADSLYAPYGERDDDFIAERTLAIGEWLVQQGAKALVVACNTATAQSIALVRQKLPIPLVGVEPGIKPAALQSKTRVAGVLATQVTLRSARFQALLERYAADCRFLCQPGHGLVRAACRPVFIRPAMALISSSWRRLCCTLKRPSSRYASNPRELRRRARTPHKR